MGASAIRHCSNVRGSHDMPVVHIRAAVCVRVFSFLAKRTAVRDGITEIARYYTPSASRRIEAAIIKPSVDARWVLIIRKLHLPERPEIKALPAIFARARILRPVLFFARELIEKRIMRHYLRQKLSRCLREPRVWLKFAHGSTGCRQWFLKHFLIYAWISIKFNIHILPIFIFFQHALYK